LCPPTQNPGRTVCYETGGLEVGKRCSEVPDIAFVFQVLSGTSGG
jgi:hypothetical protein